MKNFQLMKCEEIKEELVIGSTKYIIQGIKNIINSSTSKDFIKKEYTLKRSKGEKLYTSMKVNDLFTRATPKFMGF